MLARAHAVIVVLPQDSQPYRVLIWTPIPYAKASIWGTPYGAEIVLCGSPQI